MMERIVCIRSKKWKKLNGEVDIEVIQRMLDIGMLKLTGASSVSSAWKEFFSSKDKIGIKVNCLGGRMLSTHKEIALSVANSLKRIGVPERDIIIWDRTNKELRVSGFPINYRDGGIRCFGTDTYGIGYESDLTIFESIGSLMSRILTRLTTAQINMPILKDHGIAGITGAMKNYFGAIHNPNKYHEDNCNPFIADLNALPLIKRKSRLIIADALKIQYNGGPSYKPQWIYYYNGILLGKDPVAMDYVSYRIIEGIRKEKGMPSLKSEKREPIYIETAAKKHRLGVNDPSQIEFIEITI